MYTAVLLPSAPLPIHSMLSQANVTAFFFSSGGSFSASDISASTLNDGEGGGYVRALRVQFPSTVDLLASKVSSPHCLFAFLLVVTAILRGGSAERPLPAPQLNFAFYNIVEIQAGVQFFSLVPFHM